MLDRLPLESSAWSSLVTSMPGALPFHHPAWAGAIARCYGFRAFGLALKDARGDGYVAALPVIELRHPVTRRRRWSSLPFTDLCPALVSPADASRLATELEALRRDKGVVEIEISGPLAGMPTVPSVLRVQHVLALEPDPDAVARRFRPAVRRNIQAARARGLHVRRAESEADMVGTFYRLQLMTRRRLGLPPQPRRFFRNVWRDVLSQGLGHLTLVEVDGEPVAAGVFLDWNGFTIYKYGASDPRAWSLRPNNLLFAEEIAAACHAGSTTFHFGRTDLADDGLRRFKRGWGAEERPLEYTYFGEGVHTEQPGPPEALRNLIRWAPGFVGRTIGELLYRYVA